MADNASIYFSDDEEDKLDEFDKAANNTQDRIGYSRSQAIREAMDMHTLVLETLEEIDTPAHMSKEDREAFVERALLEFGQSDEG